MVLLPAQGMDVAAVARVAFTSEDRVRDVICNFSTDGFSSLYPKYKGGWAPKFTLAQRREIKKIAKSHPVGHGLQFSSWSLAKLADFLVAEGVVARSPSWTPSCSPPRSCAPRGRGPRFYQDRRRRQCSSGESSWRGRRPASRRADPAVLFIKPANGSAQILHLG
jgi:transposase